MQSRHALREASAWGAGRLEGIFMELSPDQKEAIVGGIPADVPEFIDSRAVGELLSHLADKDASIPDFMSDQAPDFADKIQVNGLSAQVGSFLTYFFYQIQTVDDFLHARGIHQAQAIALELRSFYEESLRVIPDTAEHAPDLRYVWLVEQLIPAQAYSHPHSLKAYREAAQVILAKYFEVCDVYEHPDRITAT